MGKRRNKKKKNNSTVISVTGVNYVIKHLGGPLLRHGPHGMPIAELQAKNYAKFGQALLANVQDLGIGPALVDGVKIGAVRRIGLGVTVLKLGKIRIRSV